MEAARQLVYYTVEDIYKMPDDQRAELIDGELYMMAPPGTEHQRLVREFTYQIEDYIRRGQGPCEVFPAPFAVFLNKDNRNYVEPDISVICDRSKLTEKGCNGAPDWVIEIVSPSSRSMDYYRKLFKYRTAGVREYWVVDADKDTVTVYDFEHDTMEEHRFADKVRAGIYEDLEISLPGITKSIQDLPPDNRILNP